MTQTVLPHVPVLAAAVEHALDTMAQPPRRIVDGTLGNGGHAALWLTRFPQAQLLGIDRDAAALERARIRLQAFEGRVTFVHGEFAGLDRIAERHGWESADAVLLDVGVSSPQIDDPARGFSWRNDGPLDMRMDQGQERTASRILNRASEEELADIFYQYGELRNARKLARAVVERRTGRPWSSTAELAAFCDEILGRGRPGSLPAPTLVFQALRIAVNDELGQLERGLAAALHLLRSGGRMAVIAFHSLEDRIVKNFFRDRARGCICPPGLPVCVCHHRPEVTILTKSPLTADAAECAANRRAACAKLRIAEKTDQNKPF